MNTTLFGGVSAWDAAGSSTSGTPTNTSTGFGAPAATPTYSGGVSYSVPVGTGFGTAQPVYTAPVYVQPTPTYNTGFSTPSYSAPIDQGTGFNPVSQQPTPTSTPTYSGGVSQTVQPAVTVPVSNNTIDYRPVQNNTSYAYSNNPMSFASLPGLPGSETPAAPIQNRQSAAAAVLPQQNNYLGINGGGNTSVNSGVNASATARTSQPITWGQNVGGTFYDTSGQMQGAFTLAQIQQLGGQTQDASGYHSIGDTAQAYAAQTAAAQQKQQGQAAFGIARSSGGSGAAGNSAAMGPYNASLTTLAQLQNQLASGKNSSGQPLGYYDRQEIQTQISQLYNQTMNWNTGDEQQLAKVMDEKAKAEARAYLNNPTTYNGVVNSNEYQKMTLQATYGLNAQQVVADGGHAGWGAGDQQLALLQEAQPLGVGVPTSLLVKAGFDSQHWDQSQQIYNPAAGSPGDAMSWNTGLAYNSMGVGAGQGYTNNDAAYGSGGIWNPAVWGSYYEPGGGYDATGGAQGMWNKFQKSNLSYGGGNYIGDPNYGKIATQYDFSGPTNGGPSIGGQANPTYDSQGALPGMIQYWRGQGYSPAQIDQLIEANGGTLPPKASVPNSYDTKNEQMDAIRYYQKLTGGTSHPELGTIDGFKGYAEGKLSQFAEMAGIGGSELTRITSPVFDAPNGGAVGSGKLTTSNPANDVFNSPVNASYADSMPPIGEEQFKWIDDFAKAHGYNPSTKPTSGKAVSVSNPNADVFSGTQPYRSPAQDYSQSTRIDNSGLLDGIIQGQINGGDKSPAAGWAQVYNQNVADQTAALRKQSKRGESGLLNAILSAYH